MMLADVQYGWSLRALRSKFRGLWLRRRRSQRGPQLKPHCLLLWNCLRIMGNKLSLHWTLKWKLRHWILMRMIWRRGKLDHGGLSLAKQSSGCHEAEGNACFFQKRKYSCQSQISQPHNSHNPLTRSLHVARSVQNSSNSVGDGVVQGRGVCVPGETKALSASTRCGVRCSAVDEYAHPQQAPLKLHVETWEGLLRNQGLRFSQEKEIVQECAVVVACPSCPDNSPEPPGQGSIIRNMLGWSQLVKTAWSGVWLFRSAFEGENLFSSLAVAGDWERKGSYHTAWSVPCDSSCSCSYAYVRGPAFGPQSGRRCWSLLTGLCWTIAPLMKPWCVEEEVPTVANLNLYRGLEIVCGLALRRRTSMWKVW